jgi:hypothetical protein
VPKKGEGLLSAPWNRGRGVVWQAALAVILALLAVAAGGGAALAMRHAQQVPIPSGSVVWVSPSDGDVISGESTLQVTAPDTTTLTTFYLDDRTIGVAARGSPWSAPWDTFRFANGPHQLLAVSRLLGGEVVKSRPIRVRVANTADPVVAAAGDIACSPLDPMYNNGQGAHTACRMMATSSLLAGRNLTAVLLLGDTQYLYGELAAYEASYDASWGRYKDISSPALGNHEYLTPGAAGYFAYFGIRAGDAAKGYYSFDLGSWHIVALNTQCEQVGGCGAGSAEDVWLRADLAAHTGTCTLAFGHIPRFSSSVRGDETQMLTFWQDLYKAGADLVLNGHEHEYERFAPMDAEGNLDLKQGIREIIAGTGGAEHEPFGNIRPNSEARSDRTFGVLLLTLHPAGYSWQFVPEHGGTFTDAGSANCH